MKIKKAISALPREVRAIAAMLVIGLSFFYLANNIMRGLKQIDLARLKPQPLPLVLSLLLCMVASFIGAWCWALILDGLGQHLPLRTNARIHFNANIVKYLPGYGWQILGKAYLCSRQGLPSWPIGVGIALEFFCVACTGLWVAVLTLPGAWLGGWGLGWLTPWRWPCLIVLAVLLIALPGLLHYGLQRLSASREQARSIVIHRGPLWLMLLLMIAAWFILGVSLHTLTAALYPLPIADLRPLTFSWAVSSIFSLAVVFVPVGIGVKEGFLAFLLGFRLPMAMAAIVAVLARVVSIVSDALSFAIAQRL